MGKKDNMFDVGESQVKRWDGIVEPKLSSLIRSVGKCGIVGSVYLFSPTKSKGKMVLIALPIVVDSWVKIDLVQLIGRRSNLIWSKIDNNFLRF